MAIVKSDLIKQLADNYPNFIRKDLTKLIDIILKEMEKALLSNERVELRDTFTLEPKIQKLMKKLILKKKKKFILKCQKNGLKK